MGHTLTGFMENYLFSKHLLISVPSHSVALQVGWREYIGIPHILPHEKYMYVFILMPKRPYRVII